MAKAKASKEAKPVKSSKEATPQPDKITGKKIGVNMIATIDGQKYSKKLGEEDLDLVKRKIELYNKKNSEATKKAIIKLLAPEAARVKKAKEDLQVKEKAIKKRVKKVAKEAEKADAGQRDFIGEVKAALAGGEITETELRALLTKAEAVKQSIPAPAVAAPARRFRDEH